MNVIDAPLAGVRVFEPGRFEDERGWFQELWNEARYREAGLDVCFVQTNISSSRRGVVRGLHYQLPPHEQGKLVTVVKGAVFDVVVDIRRGSPTFARWYGCELTCENRRQLWVPHGFAHGFLVVSHSALLHYQCTTAYVESADRTIVWNDPGIGIEWPTLPTTVSARDRAAPTLVSIPLAQLPPS